MPFDRNPHTLRYILLHCTASPCTSPHCTSGALNKSIWSKDGRSILVGDAKGSVHLVSVQENSVKSRCASDMTVSLSVSFCMTSSYLLASPRHSSLLYPDPLIHRSNIYDLPPSISSSLSHHPTPSHSFSSLFILSHTLSL